MFRDDYLYDMPSVSCKGYWHQWADERFGDPPPKVDPGAFGGQR